MASDLRKLSKNERMSSRVRSTYGRSTGTPYVIFAIKNERMVVI